MTASKKLAIMGALIAVCIFSGYHLGLSKPRVISGPCVDTEVIIADKDDCVAVNDKMICMRK